MTREERRAPLQDGQRASQGPIAAQPIGRTRWRPVLALLLLSPICAEYLIGYQQNISRPADMLAGLVILAPLYGSVAVIIRDLAKRTGRGWPTTLLLGAAFGLIQAGVIDQSLFNPDYGSDVGVPQWEAGRLPTIIPGTGISLNHLFDFVVGHVIWSFGAPIALVDSCTPLQADRPWLARRGLIVMVLLYLLAAAFVLHWHLTTTQYSASFMQLGTTLAVAAGLAALAFAIPCQRSFATLPIIRPWVVACMALVVLATHHVSTPTWIGLSVAVTLLGASALLVLSWSGNPAWSQRHVLALAGAALVINAAFGFLVQPVGNPSMTMKYVSNTILLLSVCALAAWAFHRQRRVESPAGTQHRIR